MLGSELGHTVSVIVEVEKLVAPLRDDSESVLEEGNDDKKAPYGW